MKTHSLAGLARQAELDKERREEAKKHEDKLVPTEWQAELQDKRLVRPQKLPGQEPVIIE